MSKANCKQINRPNGLIEFYSYTTLVAIRHCASGREFRTNRKWSVTTSKHLNKWCSPDAILVSQELLEEIARKGVSAYDDSLSTTV